MREREGGGGSERECGLCSSCVYVLAMKVSGFCVSE